MAKINLSKNTFTLIPEGVTTFKVMEVDDSSYEDYGKLTVKLQTSDGSVHNERFTLMKANGNLNEGALKAWSFFARTCLNNRNVEEIDTADIVGCYITTTVSHEYYSYVDSRTGEEKEGTNVRLKDYKVATSFGNDDELSNIPPRPAEWDELDL